MAYDPLQEHKQNQAARESAKALYDSGDYQLEKLIGKRTKTGALKLKKLKPRHRHIIAMHLMGSPNRDIAFILNIDEITVSRVLHDPLAEEFIALHTRGIEKELEALAGLGVDALRTGLQDNDIKIRLRASNQLFDALDKHKKHQAGAGNDTAEDAISRALKAIEGQTDVIKELVRPDRPTAIDVAFKEVKPDGDNQQDRQQTQQRLPPMDLERTRPG